MIGSTQSRERPAYIPCSAGRDPDEALLAWMREFAARTGAPFFYEQRGERFGFGPPAFQQEMLAKLERGERLWGSRTDGHPGALPQQEGADPRTRDPGA